MFISALLVVYTRVEKRIKLFSLLMHGQYSYSCRINSLLSRAIRNHGNRFRVSARELNYLPMTSTLKTVTLGPVHLPPISSHKNKYFLTAMEQNSSKIHTSFERKLVNSPDICHQKKAMKLCRFKSLEFCL